VQNIQTAPSFGFGRQLDAAKKSVAVMAILVAEKWAWCMARVD
jgi:hypothetical protein